MAKRKFNLQTRNSRRSIPVGPKLHVSPLIERLAVGYRKGVRGGSWFARRHEVGTKYSFEPLGTADDVADADGIEVLTYDQAKAKAEEWFARKSEEKTGGVVIDEQYCIAQLMADYIQDRERRKLRPQVSSKENATAHILPSLGKLKVSELNHALVKRWFDALADAEPRNGKARFDKSNPETMRKRQTTANRIFATLRAALNWGFEEGKLSSRNLLK